MPVFFSIVIPTLNEEKYLPNILTDLINQTEKDFEVVVVDGNSKDNTKEIAKKFETSLKLKFIGTKKSNVALQRNLGSKNCFGQYIFFIDADTRIKNNTLKKLKEIIEEKKSLIYLPALAVEKKEGFEKFSFKAINYAIELSQLTDVPFSTGGSFAILRTYFEHLGGFDEKLFLSEDHDLIRRAKRYGVKAFFVKDVECFVSLRRLEREGIIDTLYKYSIAFLYTLAKGKIDKKIINYEMGGDK